MKPRTKAIIAAVAIIQLTYNYFSAPIYFPHLKYATLEKASSLTRDWFEEAKEKRNRREMTELAKNNIPAMPPMVKIEDLR